MAKTKKISINTLDKIMKENYIKLEPFEWYGNEVIVKRTLSFKEVLEFVDSVVKSCFSYEDGAYMPEVKDFAIKTCILEKYANFALPNNVEHKYELVYQTNAVEEVLQRVNARQYNEIITAIDLKVSHLASANIEAVNKQMNELYSAFNNLQEQLENMFSGVNPEDFTKMLGAFAENGIDEAKLVDAFKSK